jgi:hypothetical protein
MKAMSLKSLIVLLTTTAIGGLLPAVHPAFGQTWTQTSAPSNSWLAVASSADGARLVALASSNRISGQIYTSTNSGVDWTSNGAPNVSWFSIASSADGTKLAAITFRGSVYTSPDSGGTWNDVLDVPVNPSDYFPVYPSVACSADGTQLAVLILPTCIFISTNSGATWMTNRQSAFVSGFDQGPTNCSVASSADGSKLAVAFAMGDVARSADSGMTWVSNGLPVLVDKRPAEELIGHWNGIASSADGNELVVVTGLAGSPPITPIYISTNAGMTWQTSGAPTNLETSWRAAALSADGSKIVAAAGWWNGSGPIYTSADSGLTWVSNRAPVALWSAVASSADGSKLVATVDGGGIYTFQSTPAPQLKIVSSGGEIILSWIAPSANFTLQQNSDLTTTNWMDVTNASTLNLSTLQDEIVLPAPATGTFYRLTTP